MRALNLPNLSGLTLVVVDDNDDSLDMLDTFLTQCGAEVKAARNVDTALSFINTEPSIDAVVSDLSMPGRDGLDLIRQVRRHNTRANLPAIALTRASMSTMQMPGAPATTSFCKSPSTSTSSAARSRPRSQRNATSATPDK
jgi:CheY-like chemotaxis protein